MLFTSIIGYIAARCSLTYPATANHDSIRASSQLILDHLDKMSLTELLNYREQDTIASYFKTMPAPSYQSRAKFFHKHARGDREKVWAVESQAIADQYVAPLIQSLPGSLIGPLAEFLQNAPKNKYDSTFQAIVDECPALHNHIEAMTRNSEDQNRKDRVNDFFDLEMMPVPLAYADVFATKDKWVRERFVKPGGFLNRSNCSFCTTSEELENWLDTN